MLKKGRGVCRQKSGVDRCCVQMSWPWRVRRDGFRSSTSTYVYVELSQCGMNPSSLARPLVQERSPRHCHQDWEPLRGVQMGVKPSENIIIVRCFKTQNPGDNQTPTYFHRDHYLFGSILDHCSAVSSEIGGTITLSLPFCLASQEQVRQLLWQVEDWRPHQGWFDGLDRRAWSWMDLSNLFLWIFQLDLCLSVVTAVSLQQHSQMHNTLGITWPFLVLASNQPPEPAL